MIQVDRDLLFKPLRATIGTVASRQTIPIFSDVLIEAGEGRLSVTAMDAEMQVTARTDPDGVADAAPVAVSGRKLHDLLRYMREDAVVAIEPNGTRLRVVADGSKFHLQMRPAADFPKLAPFESAVVEITLPQRALKRLLGQTHRAMADKDIRYWLCGTLLQLYEDNLVTVATDHTRLTEARLKLPSAVSPAAVILPRKAAIELHQLLEDNDQPVRICIHDRLIGFSFERVELVSKLIDGRFPDYQKIVPASCAQRFRIDRLLLQQALQRAALVSGKVRGVRWTASDDRLIIEAQNGDSEECEEVLTVQHDGDQIEFAMNVDYALDALASVADADTVECGFNDPRSSMQLTVPGDDGFKHLLMPMRL